MRVVVLDDDTFSRTFTVESLAAAGHDVMPARSAQEALDVVAGHDPHVIVCDVNLGVGPSGVDVAWHVHDTAPWVGIVILTAHPFTPATRHMLPPHSQYVPKAGLSSSSELTSAVSKAVSNTPAHFAPPSGQVVVTASQADTLMLLAQGFSNVEISRRKGVSVRAVEASLRRLFQSLGLSHDPSRNSRVLAAMMWSTGQVGVRE